MRKSDNRFFTLIELLIVIAIIAVLAGMLLPALNSAREQGKSITCLSDFKQLGLACQMYSNDNSDYLLPAELPFADSSTGNSARHFGLYAGLGDRYLTPYLGVHPYATYGGIGVANNGTIYRTPMLCPSLKFNNTTVNGYVLSYQLRGKKNSNGSAALVAERVVKLGSLKYPSDLLHITEGNSNGLMVDWDTVYTPDLNKVCGSMDFRHRGSANLLFADAHAESRVRSKVPCKEHQGTDSYHSSFWATGKAQDLKYRF